jgi:hypothetical protein
MTSRELSLYRKHGASALAAEAERQLAARTARSRRTAPKRKPGREAKEAKRAAEAAVRAEVRAACVARAEGDCEACARFAGAALHLDHFWGRAREESVESCWMLCPGCDHEKTENKPTRQHWLHLFSFHCRNEGYADQVAKCDRALALEAAQHPSPPATLTGADDER